MRSMEAQIGTSPVCNNRSTCRKDANLTGVVYDNQTANLRLSSAGREPALARPRSRL